jgi:hypothetical protein
MHDKISNFIFGDTSALFSNDVAKFNIKRRNGTIWTPARKHALFNEGDRMVKVAKE